MIKPTILRLWLLAGLSLTLSLPAPAQTTAFTYQGRLTDGSQPATGLYDFQFQIYDAADNGTPVTAPLLVTNVTASNGSFTVTLDFGANVFYGPNRWLELAVRTNNSSGSLVTLSPRQPITPVPYAIYAGTAGSVFAGAISNAQVAAGAIGNANLQANAVTVDKVATGQLVRSLNGLKDDVVLQAGPGLAVSTAGNVVQISTNGSASAANTTWSSLDNPLFLSLLPANFSLYTNYNRYSWKNTMRKLQARQPVTILISGEGRAMGGWTPGGGGLLDGPAHRLNDLFGGDSAHMGWPAGVASMHDATWFYQLPNGGAQLKKDTNWVNGYLLLTNSANIITWTDWRGVGITADSWSISYIENPGGGWFAVQTNINSGPFQTLPQFSAVNASNSIRTGKVISWTNPVPALCQVRLVGLSNITTLPVINCSARNYSAATNGGVQLAVDYSNGGVGWDTFTNVSYAIRAPIYKAWDPDLILLMILGDMTSDAAEDSYLNFLRTNNPSTDIVLCKLPPTIDPTNVAQDAKHLRFCIRYGLGLFDGYTPFAPFANWNARGFCLGDGIHPSDAGIEAYGNLLTAWLDLGNALIVPPN